MQLIAAAEGKRRGSYGGAVGYFTAHGDLDTCIVIRSAYTCREVSLPSRPEPALCSTRFPSQSG